MGFAPVLGPVIFPATQIAVADPNTLDDYEEGIWTPTLTFATPGDLSVTYVNQFGRYTKLGNVVQLSFNIRTDTFTHTTASGNLRITGLPFTSINVAGLFHASSCVYEGITSAGRPHINPTLFENSTFLIVDSSGSAISLSRIDAPEVPSGGIVIFRCSISYLA